MAFPQVTLAAEMSDSEYELWCFIKQDNTMFAVTVPATISIYELKKRIKDEKSNQLASADASDLALWKVSYFQ